MLRWWVVLSVCALAGCASLPAAEKASALGEAISSTGKLLRDSLAANRTIAVRIGEEVQAYNYIKNDVFTLDDEPVGMLPEKEAGVRLSALAALEQYGDALAKAIDEGTIDKLQQASVNLGGAVAGLVTLAAPEATPIATPAIKLAARLGGFLMGNAYANEIHAIIVARNNDVKAVVRLLKRDFQKLPTLMQAQLEDYKNARTDTLTQLRSSTEDGAVDRLRLYGEYKLARQDMSAIATLSKAAAKYQQVLSGLETAHDAVATDKPNGEVLLRRFIALSTELADLIKAIRKENA